MDQQKTCTKCCKTQSLTSFYKQARGKFGVTSRCKSCCSSLAANHYRDNRDVTLARNRSWLEANRDAHRDLMARWYQDNRDAVAARNIAWRKANPEAAKAHQNRHAKKRYSTPKGRLEAAIKSGLRRGLIAGSKAGRSTFDLLGFSVDELRTHLESLFHPGMNWENYGEWHVDHIIPLAAHNYQTPDDIDFARAWTLSNLQPLWAAENMSKKDKLATAFQPSLSLRFPQNAAPTTTGEEYGRSWKSV